MRYPRILSHVFDSDSKTATLGYMVFGVASYGAFIAREPSGQHVLNADTWLICTAISTTLIGGKLVAESVLEAIQLKLNGAPKPAAPVPAVPAAQPPAAA